MEVVGRTEGTAGAFRTEGTAGVGGEVLDDTSEPWPLLVMSILTILPFSIICFHALIP